MANSTVCQIKLKPKVEPRRAKPKTYRELYCKSFDAERVFQADTIKRQSKFKSGHSLR